MVEPVGGLLTVLLPCEAGLIGGCMRSGRVQLLQKVVGLPPSRERCCIGGSRCVCRLSCPAVRLQVPCRLAPLLRQLIRTLGGQVPDELLDVLPKPAVGMRGGDRVCCGILRQPSRDGVAELLIVQKMQ